MIDSKFNQLLQRLNSQQSNVGNSRPLQFDNNPVSDLGLSGLTPHTYSIDVLSRWFWLDNATVKAIDLGNFDINELPKLQREESARNHYLTKASNGFRMSLDGSKLELITTRAELQSTFTNLELFLSAWQVYISVRTQFHPGYSSSLAFWTERLIYKSSFTPET
jgi:hypothetical protein